jgi:hypothetical protein
MALVEKYREVCLRAAVETSLDGACHKKNVPQYVLRPCRLVTTSTSSSSSNPTPVIAEALIRAGAASLGDA